jgi:hypothetical protein
LTQLIEFQPDLVIVYDGVNDAIKFNNKIGLNYRWFFKNSVHQGIRQRIKESYTMKGSFRHFQESLMSAWPVVGEFFNLQFSTRLPPENPPIHSPDSIFLYKENLEQMISLCQNRKINIALFFQPALGISNEVIPAENFTFPPGHRNVRKQFYAEGKLMFKELKVEHAQEKTVYISDLSETFLNNRTVFADSCHLNEEGNKIIAQKIVAQISQALSLPK